ncbi:hypothetical protein C9F11_38430 [Streptomyces sp. YIM 121038]|uniref:hypothetical protein n=1 Tax=Streptomyces sp. YIM 121038 TaxID=2136401 RepID=UPI0011103C83|nr:hypothetical protein [Streptomyces sp. YIM 121038]QCX81269.1 hypothetical protein C9F11_38430 [Streptomyces sp. YIM 121038]
MPEETEQQEQQQDTAAEAPVEETATEENGTAEQQDDAPEADSDSEEEPFDRRKFEAALRKKNSEAENLRRRLKEQEPLLAELQQRKDAEKSVTDRLNDQLARANEQITTTRQRLVRTQVQALAMTGFADPEDAVGALDLGSYIGSDGDIDEAAIKADLDALLERKPHWAKSQPLEGPRRPAPDRTQASGANKQRTLNPADEFAGFIQARLK